MTIPGADATGGATLASGSDAARRPAGRSPMTDEETAVLDAVRWASADRPYKQDALAAAVGLSTRRVQRILKTLTEEHGVPIVSRCRKPFGVFIAESPEDAKDYIAQLRSRATSCFKRVAAISRASAVNLVNDLRQEVIAFPDADLRVERLVCAECHEDFEPSRSTQIYCSPECRYDAARERGSI